MRSTGIKGVVFVVTLAFLHFLVRGGGDTEVTCVLTESCILPCKFQAGKEILIHWIHVTAGDTRVHSYYHDKDQFTKQGQRFRNRTSLFKEQISRGNASLRLTQVETGDQGRYKCHTSIPDKPGPEISFINLKVEDAAPVTPTSVLLSSTQPNFPAQVHENKGASDNDTEKIKIIIGVLSSIFLATIGGLTVFCLHRRGICRNTGNPPNPPLAVQPGMQMRERSDGGEQRANDEAAPLNDQE